MFSSLFDLDNPILRFLSRLVDLVVLNVIFIISCIPVVTIGAALTALYYVCINDWDTQNAHIFQKYMRSFKQNFKQSTIIWLIMLVAGAIIGTDAWFSLTQWQSTGSGLYQVGIVICMIGLLAYLLIFTFVWPLQAKFENTVGKTIHNALSMGIAHLPKVVIAWCIAGVAGYCVYEYLVMKAMLFALVFSTVAYLQSILFRTAFQPYLEADKRKEGEVWTHKAEADHENSYEDAKIQVAELAAGMDGEVESDTDSESETEETAESENIESLPEKEQEKDIENSQESGEGPEKE